MRGSAAFRTGVAPGGALAGPWVPNELWRQARAVPSLDLRFADNKSLVDATTGQNLVTFTRASSGTYVGSDRLIKTATTNLLLQSEDFSTTWTTTRASVSVNTAVAPNGTVTADKLIEDSTASSSHQLNQLSVSFTSGLAYTLSIFVKAAERANLRLTLPAAAFTSALNAQFNIAAGTVVIASGAATASIVPVGDGWYRCSMTATATTTATGTISLLLGELATSTTASYTGDGASGLLLWGAQLEQSSTVGEYIPTTSTINSAPRFDHNPTTGESLGLLVEESRTNLFLQSNQFDTTWTNSNSSETAAAGIAPDGTNTAWELRDTSDASAAAHSLTQSVPFTSGNAYTFTVWMKAGTLNEGGIAIPSAAFGAVLINRINLSTGAVISTSVNSTTVVTPFGNGWYRIALTATATATASGSVQIRPMNGGTTYIGTGTGTVLIWGAQLEAGALPTSYIPTTSATVTRSTDVASISGSNFSSWYRQDEGTVFVSARTNATHGGVNSFPRIYAISDGTNDNVIQNYYRVLSGYTDAGYNVTTLTVAQAGIDTNNERNGQSQSTAYANNDFAFAINGSLVNTDNTGTVPTVSQLRLGARGTGLGLLNGTIRRLTYWPQRLPNETLQTITQ